MNAVEFFRALLGEDSGATAVEYGLIVALIVIAIISSLEGFADGNSGMWARVEQTITTATSSGSP